MGVCVFKFLVLLEQALWNVRPGRVRRRSARASLLSSTDLPWSAGSTSLFSSELLTDVGLLDRLATFVEPVYMVGDVNIHVERHNSQ